MQASTLKISEKMVKAFANRRRIAIVIHLKTAKTDSVTSIARAIGLSLKSTSRHLGVLLSAGVLEKDQRSLQMFYRIAPDQHLIAKTILTVL